MSETPWNTPARPATERERRPVKDLPDWDPLPPGEIVVRRPGTKPSEPERD